jgi:hypothetical protein
MRPCSATAAHPAPAPQRSKRERRALARFVLLPRAHHPCQRHQRLDQTVITRTSAPSGTLHAAFQDAAVWALSGTTQGNRMAKRVIEAVIEAADFRMPAARRMIRAGGFHP